MSAAVIGLPTAKKREQERRELLERAFLEIEASGLGALAEHVLRVRRSMRRHVTAKWRTPYGLAISQDKQATDHCCSVSQYIHGVTDPDPKISEGKQTILITQPQCVSRFTHLVVTEDTAQHFVLNDYKIGKDSQIFGELDLTLFSMKYQESDELSDIFRLEGGDVAQAAQIVRLFIRRKVDGHGPKNFTGILWAEFDL